MNEMNIGIKEADRIKVADKLKVLLADSYTLYLQTHNFHWNVTGVHFKTLHLMFEEQYTELATAVDDIAERIRSLGVYAPGSYKSFSKLSNIRETDDDQTPKAEEMVALLVQSHEEVIRSCREALSVAQTCEDESSASLIADRLVLHEKTAWMLRASQDL